jgi:hypothetical protein
MWNLGPHLRPTEAAIFSEITRLIIHRPNKDLYKVLVLFVCFCSIRDQTQGLMYAWQESDDFNSNHLILSLENETWRGIKARVY